MLVLRGLLDLAVLADPVDLRGQEARGQRGRVALQGHRVHQGLLGQALVVPADRVDLLERVQRVRLDPLDRAARLDLREQLVLVAQ